MKKIISKSNISKILGAGAILGLFLSMLIVSPVFPKTANAGWIDSNIFGGGTFFTDDILGIDPEKDRNKTPAINVTCSANPGSITVGNSTNWSASVSGGNGSYTYSWSGNDGLSGNTSSVQKSYFSVGNKSASVKVKSGGKSATAKCSVRVQVPETQSIVASCSANPSSVNIGDSLNWNTSVSGGTGSYNYSWNGTDGLYGNSSSVSKVYNTSGSKNATVVITSGSQSVTRNCNAIVNQAPINNLVVSCNSNISNADIDEDVTWESYASGGTGSYSYSWSGTNGLSGNNRNIVWNYDTSGTKRGTVTVTSNGQSASASCNMYINQDNNNNNNNSYNNLVVSCYASPSNPQINNQMNWYANVSGGNGNYTYSWYGSDGLNSSSRSPYMTYSTPGSKSATVTVWSNGRSTSANCYTNVGQNSVLSFSQAYQAPLASAVYLSQIPSTGVYDNMKLVYFVGFLALFSAWIAYIVIARKKEAGELN